MIAASIVICVPYHVAHLIDGLDGSTATESNRLRHIIVPIDGVAPRLPPAAALITTSPDSIIAAGSVK
jgi:hypothetical protein